MTKHVVRVTCGALDTWNGDTVLRAVIDASDLDKLVADEYQRERLNTKKIAALKEAFWAGSRLPDIELSLRTTGVLREGDGTFWLNDNPYIVDGQQRVIAAMEAMAEDPTITPRLGALIHVGKTAAWERDRFEVVNLGQTRVSSNVTLRNLRHKLLAARLLYGLAVEDEKFVLRGRVTYGQSSRTRDLMSAVTLFKVVGMLHSRMGAARSNNVVELAKGLDKIVELTGEKQFVENVETFFDAINVAWGIQEITYGSRSTQMKVNFLMSLARVFNLHRQFWNEEKLQIGGPFLNRMARFNLADTFVKELANGSSSSTASDNLFYLLRDHLQTASKPLTLW